MSFSYLILENVHEVWKKYYERFFATYKFFLIIPSNLQ